MPITPPPLLHEFSGAPREAGRAYGEAVFPVARAVLAARIEARRQVFAAPGVLSQAAFVKAYESAVARWAPHWMEEFEGLCGVLGLPLETFLLLHAPAPFPEQCTSWIVMPDASAHGGVLLHKNRDTDRATCQGLIVKRVSSTLRWWGPVDLPFTAPLAMINEAGVAAVMNSGEACAENHPVGLGTPEILRLLAERARSAEEAVALLEAVIGAGDYAHGRKGSIFLVADPRRAFIVENTARHRAHEEITHGCAVRSNHWRLPAIAALRTASTIAEGSALRYDRVHTLLSETVRRNRIGLPDCQAIAGDRVNGEPRGGPRFRAVTSGGTAFAFTAAPDPDAPALFSRMAVALGPPTTTCAVPLAVGAAGSPGVLLTAALADRAYRLRDSHWLDAADKLGIPAMNVDVWRRFKKYFARARSAGTDDSARRVLSESLADLATRADAFLERQGSQAASPDPQCQT